MDCLGNNRSRFTEHKLREYLKLIDNLLGDYKKPEDIIGENGLLKQLTKALLERAMQAEMTEHLGYSKDDRPAKTVVIHVMEKRPRR